MPNRIHRRKFLERSALGAGGVLLLPILLESCMDHDIPDPDDPTVEQDIDWNDDARTMVTSVIEMIPEAGDILGGLVDIFWPSSQEDVWGEIKDQVEALVNQAIAAAVYTQVSEDLQGLNNSLTLYLNELKEGDSVSKLTQWMITKNLFVVALPHFQSSGNELPLLPLFGQFANLYLALLRDGVGFAGGWGRSSGDQAQDIIDLKNNIQQFYNYTANTYNAGRLALSQKTKANNHENEPFKTINNFDRQMTLTVLDFMNSWPYFDITLYPNGTDTLLTREIYTDPYGTCDDSGNIVIKTPEPTQRPTNLTVWGFDRIDAVQLTYPSGSGPGGVTTTPRMGDQGGGTNQSPHGGSFNISPGVPIIQARATWGSIVNTLQFTFDDGTVTSMMGGNAGWGGNDTGMLGYLYEALSSVHINGISDFYDSADCVVFGFQYWKSPAATLRAISLLYVKSPKERSAQDFANEFPNLSISANAITDKLKAARKAYWEYMKARAKEIKG